MTFYGRLRYYAFGLLLGIMMVYAMFGTRSCTMPNELKVRELVFQYLELSDKAKCKLKCMRKNEALLKMELRHFEVNYDLTQVHKKPCGEYYVQPRKEYAGQYNYNIVMLDCDTITRINDINIAPGHTCSCQ